MNVEKSCFFCLKSDSFLSRSRFTRDWGMLKDYFLIPPLWDSAKAEERRLWASAGLGVIGSIHIDQMSMKMPSKCQLSSLLIKP